MELIILIITKTKLREGRHESRKLGLGYKGVIKTLRTSLISLQI